MLEIASYLSCLDGLLSSSLSRQLLVVASAMLCCRGQVTMLNLSRWSGKGGSYRTIQRFYASSLCWSQANWILFTNHRLQEDEVYLLTGDETIATKSGKCTHGLGKFFSSIASRCVKSVGFFSLCLVGVSSGEASPLLMEQLDSKMKKQTKVKKDKTSGQGKGRPKGSKNKNREDIEFTDYLKWIRGNILKTLQMIGDRIQIAYFVYDGAFGNNECLQMVKSCGLPLISKLPHNSALHFPYQGEQKKQGAPKKYGERVNYPQIPDEYLMEITIQGGVEEMIYQLEVLHKDFVDPLNVTILQRRRIADAKVGQVILFSNDLELSWDKMILYYRLRFQIEFTFRDAKQYWGLEDFMNIKQTPVENAANLSMFMVNLSRIIASQVQKDRPQSMLDLKAQAQALFYLEQILKIDPQISGRISLETLQKSVTNIGCIHPQKNEIILQNNEPQTDSKKTIDNKEHFYNTNELDEKSSEIIHFSGIIKKSLHSIADYLKSVTREAS